MGNFYDKLSDDQKICYLLGCLADYTSWVQEKNFKEGDSKNEEYSFGSFRRKFNNLRYNKGKLKEIFVDCVSKLNQYNYKVPRWFTKEWKTIKKEINDIDLDNITISYYFTLGYAIGSKIFSGGEEDESNI